MDSDVKISTDTKVSVNNNKLDLNERLTNVYDYITPVVFNKSPSQKSQIFKKKKVIYGI
ncbi:MAG: hypothetical protein WBG43_06750 [Marinifilaceae bacterium]